jgi:RNA polymerase sigma factor (sigma-70 family)
MSKDSGGSVTRDDADLRSPDSMVRERAARRLWERFEQRLLDLVRRRLNPGLRVQVDENDIVQSLFERFLVIEREATSPLLSSREELWRFLVWMAMCRVASVALRHQASRGDVRRESRQTFPAFSDLRLGSWLAEMINRNLLLPEQSAISREEFNRLLGQLPEDLQQIFIWKLEGYTNVEIGRMLNRTVRTVELKIMIIRKTLERDAKTRAERRRGG